MSMIIPAGEDEPPEPAPEGDHSALTLVDDGVRFMLHAHVLVTKLKIAKSFPKSKARGLRPWRHNMSVVAARDNRYTLRFLATVWRRTVSSVKCDVPLRNSQRTDRLFPYQRVDAVVAIEPFIIPLVAPPVPQAPVGESFTYNPTTSHPLSTVVNKFCIPVINVTPPSDDTSLASLYNMVPTPQDAAFGDQLTVPDPEIAVVNERGHARDCLEGLEVLRVDRHGADVVCQEEELDLADAEIHEDGTAECLYGLGIKDEDEDEVDLARTWCG